MSTTQTELQQWMAAPSETEHLEFKEAANQFDFNKLLHYCCALANEGGGVLILGVTNKPPRRIAGTQAFPNLEKVKGDLYPRLHFRVDVDELNDPNGRGLVFHIPSRPVGQPVRVDRIYWMRAGESLTEMSEDRLKQIFAEADESLEDFSGKICAAARLDDLEPEALEDFRRRWLAKSGNIRLAGLGVEQLLADAELAVERQLTYAALILFGKRPALTRLLANAEVIFEYRSSEGSIPHQQREEFREGLFLFYDKLWNLVNLRNDLQHYQDGLFIWDIPTFNERAVREAILNAVSHRDYRSQGSIFIRQYPAKIEIVSPGGWPPGVTTETLIYRQKARNRRLAEALSRCGLVERAGQGYDEIYTLCVKEAKPLPDFTHTDTHQISVALRGTVQDAAFLRFLGKVGENLQQSFSVEDFLVLDHVRRELAPPDNLRHRIAALRAAGVVEVIGRGRGTHYVLSRKFAGFLKERGHYTRRLGLGREQNKELLLSHLKHHNRGRMEEFQQVLPSLSRNQILSLLKELKKSNRIEFVGITRHGHWVLKSPRQKSKPSCPKVNNA